MVLYSVTNIKTQEEYVGITSGSVKRRWQKHWWAALRGKSPYHFHRALAKYGKESFRWDIIEEHESYEALKQAEISFIQSRKESGVSLYNMTKGGNGVVGMSPSPETRAKLSAANLGKRDSVETRAKKSLAKKGKPLGPKSTDHRKKISDSLKKLWS